MKKTGQIFIVIAKLSKIKINVMHQLKSNFSLYLLHNILITIVIRW